MDQKQKRRQVYFNIQNMRKTLKISEELHQRIKVYCVINKIKMSEWLEETISEKLKVKNDSK